MSQNQWFMGPVVKKGGAIKNETMVVYEWIIQRKSLPISDETLGDLRIKTGAINRISKLYNDKNEYF